MKITTTYFFSCFFVFTSFSQNSSGKVEYKMFLSFSNIIEYKSSLVFDNENSLFSYKVSDDGFYESGDRDLNSKTILIDTTTSTILTKKKRDTLYESQIDKGKGVYFTFEKVPLMKWELLPDTKKLDNIDCSFAKTTFRGRVYYAWYASKIPVSYGPWKLNGLPGIILEAYDETREVIFEFNRIQIPFDHSLHVVNKKIAKSNNVSLHEYISTIEKVDETDFENKIKSKFPRGISIKVEITRTGIELDYNDLSSKK